MQRTSKIIHIYCHLTDATQNILFFFQVGNNVRLIKCFDHDKRKAGRRKVIKIDGSRKKKKWVKFPIVTFVRIYPTISVDVQGGFFYCILNIFSISSTTFVFYFHVLAHQFLWQINIVTQRGVIHSEQRVDRIIILFLHLPCHSFNLHFYSLFDDKQ